MELKRVATRHARQAASASTKSVERLAAFL